MIPPVDQISAPETDVYVSNLGNGDYGWTNPENGVPTTSRTHDYTAYIQIHSTFDGSNFYTKGYEALKVTCAHEYFHVVQLGYGLWDWTDEEIWFLEASSVWMEERAFPEVNDYFQYFYTYSKYWGQSIDEYTYDNAGFNMMLEEKHPGAMLKIWTNILTQKVKPSIESYLNEVYDTKPWASALADYALSAAACGDYASDGISLYEDAPELSEISIPETNRIGAFNFDEKHELKANSYATTFYKMLYPDGIPTSMEFHFENIEGCSIQLLIKKGNKISVKTITNNNTFISATHEESEILFCIGSGPNTVNAEFWFSRPIFHISNLYPNPIISSNSIYA
ncbi:MAG: hypothetical protein KAI81_08215, partial [Candidatus Marinimicrobia bacterium]|nr:hypothetical protein [Candidatus Neomarinimicrobiota bacterium]